jgi:uncharacterized protein YjiS (DUF1127 family)
MIEYARILRPNAGIRVSKPGETIRRIVALIQLWRQRSHARRELMARSDEELRDIGITRFDAHREAGKPFWRE